METLYLVQCFLKDYQKHSCIQLAKYDLHGSEYASETYDHLLLLPTFLDKVFPRTPTEWLLYSLVCGILDYTMGNDGLHVVSNKKRHFITITNNSM